MTHVLVQKVGTDPKSAPDGTDNLVAKYTTSGALLNPNLVPNFVEGVNFVRKHTRANPQKNVQGGILERESPIDASNLMVVCSECGRPTRVGHTIQDDGKKVRVCRRCDGVLDK